MELRFRDAAHADVYHFVMRYEAIWLSAYRDTGIWSEDVFLKSVHMNASALFDDMYDTIERQLGRDNVMGRKEIGGNIYELHFRIDGRRVIVHYFEDKQENIRWVESVSIGRKPIIF
jgi:hypothetical protein